MIIRKLKSPVFSHKLIVDNEISNDISGGGSNWDYTKADVICCGILLNDDIIIMFREKGDDLEEYKSTLRTYLQAYGQMWAFNRNMEFGNFKGFLGMEYDVQEIKAWAGKGWSKQKFFEELIHDNKIGTGIIIIDTLENDSKDCIECYSKGEYEKIMQHNIADLIKQAILLEHKEYLLEKHKDKIDSNGFYRKN